MHFYGGKYLFAHANNCTTQVSIAFEFQQVKATVILVKEGVCLNEI